ncbi:MAG: hypothetical protein JJE52_05355 [Acidimicrobiia bacterium]|nr:hypothetical protein [Acidimicrobiia bacterium]
MEPDLGPGARITVVAVTGEGEVVLRRIVGAPPDLGFIEDLARLHVAAARLGIAIEYRRPCPTLAAVLELAGLDEVLVADDQSR